MWNWQAKANEKVKYPYALSDKEGISKTQSSGKALLQQFDLQAHYQQLKENHPFWAELHKPHQSVIKVSYLDSQLPKTTLSEENVFSFKTSNDRKSQMI